MKIVAQLKYDDGFDSQQLFQNNVNLALTTPYGKPSQDAFIIPVPNESIGLVIGQKGFTIKMLQQQSGASK